MKLASLSAALLLCCSSPLLAVDVSVNVGDAAPSFAAKDDTGTEWKSADHVGEKILVVYFYPADMTGGCTKQACGFRDNLGKLKDMGVEVVGVSGDTVRNHQLFKKAEDLNFTLLADTEGKVANAFGVPFAAGEKSIEREVDGKLETLTRYGTAKRWTFVIGKNKKVIYKDDNVAAAEDSEKMIAFVKGLK